MKNGEDFTNRGSMPGPGIYRRPYYAVAKNTARGKTNGRLNALL